MDGFSKKPLARVGSTVLIAEMGNISMVAGNLPYEGLAGLSGVETSLAAAKRTWGDTWKVVCAASNQDPVDAPPAATIGGGPVMFTDGSTLNLGGVKPNKIAILGGLGSVPQAIADQAKATGAEVVRLAGTDRNVTAAEITKRWAAVSGAPKDVYVTKNVGSGLSDTVAASVLRDSSIMTFTNDTSVIALAGTTPDLETEKVVALGDAGIVPDVVIKAVINGKAVARLTGSNRYETMLEIAKYVKAQRSGSSVYLASGTALKDAMVTGATKDSVILFSPANGEGVKSRVGVLSAAKLVVIGGTGIMPSSAVTAAAAGVIPQPVQTIQPTQPAQPT